VVVGSQTTAFLTDRAALIVGVVGATGRPLATRGWGLRAEGDDGDRFRLMVDAAEADELAHLAGGGAIAVTASDVPTLRSIQVKGQVVGIEPANRTDQVASERYCAGFFSDVESSDHVPRHLLERLRPEDLVALRLTVTEVFDQTPGPGAGSRLGAESA
jgi:hypothetical protein